MVKKKKKPTTVTRIVKDIKQKPKKLEKGKKAFAKVGAKERGKVEAIKAKSELNKRGLLSAKQAQEAKKPEEPKQEIKERPKPTEKQTQDFRKTIPEDVSVTSGPLKLTPEQFEEQTTKDLTSALKLGGLGVGAGPQSGARAGVQIVKGLNAVKNVALTKTGKAIIAGTAGTSTIITWLASDNIISSMNIYSRDIRNEVKFNGLDPDKAIAKLDEAQAFVENAKNFINVNTALNPLLWPFRNLIISNTEAAQLVLDNNREIISGVKIEEPEDI